MNEALRSTLEAALEHGEITLSELHSFKPEPTTNPDANLRTSIYEELASEGLAPNLRSASIIIGAIVSFAALMSLLATIWDLLTPLTLGFTVLVIQAGLLVIARINEQQGNKGISTAFSLLTGLMAPVTLSWALTTLFPNLTYEYLALVEAAIFTAIYAFLVSKSRRPSLVAFLILGSTASLISLYTSVSHALELPINEYFAFFLASIAVSYLILATKGRHSIGLTNSLGVHVLGTIGLYIFLLTRGHGNDMHTAWHAVIPFVIAGIIKSSVKRRYGLSFIVSVLASLIYISILMMAYMPEIPFLIPLVLVVAGFAIIYSGQYWKQQTNHG